jgi:hypothetical protein
MPTLQLSPWYRDAREALLQARAQCAGDHATWHAKVDLELNALWAQWQLPFPGDSDAMDEQIAERLSETSIDPTLTPREQMLIELKAAMAMPDHMCPKPWHARTPVRP